MPAEIRAASRGRARGIIDRTGASRACLSGTSPRSGVVLSPPGHPPPPTPNHPLARTHVRPPRHHGGGHRGTPTTCAPPPGKTPSGGGGEGGGGRRTMLRASSRALGYEFQFQRMPSRSSFSWKGSPIGRCGGEWGGWVRRRGGGGGESRVPRSGNTHSRGGCPGSTQDRCGPSRPLFPFPPPPRGGPP